ncbi:MAG: glycosyltransferase [Chloroflexi bacterium]|nr:glycosyltransferase [Chloroflexota bacterium]
MPSPARRTVALCLTVLNEADNLDALFSSLAGQTRQPDEIVVVDGGSQDGTPAVVEAWQARGLPITLAIIPGANISSGRNAAISRAQSEIVAVTDAGVRLEPGWLSALADPFQEADPPDVVAGFFQSDPRTPFEMALGATTLPAVDEIRPERFYPSSRSVAFTRAAWELAGGYPEWLDYCEDLLFDFALEDEGCRRAWAPDALVHFRPRSTPRAFWLQYYRYARGDGKADLWRRRHLIRYATYLGLPLGLALARRRPWLLLPMLLAAVGYVRKPYRRLRPQFAGLDTRGRLVALAWVPLLRLVGDAAKMAGYPAGLWWRLRHRDAIPDGHPRR